MQTGAYGFAIVQAFEGCLKPAGDGTFKPYICPAGVLTIGWGHTNHHEPKFTESARWPQTRCDDVLRSDLGGFERHVAKHAPEVTKQHQFDALVSWAYNTGGPASSAVWTYARKGDLAGTRERLSRWNKGGGKVLAGLVRRREAEADLFEGKIDEALRTAGAKMPSAKMPTPAEPSARADRAKPKPPATEIAKRTKAEATTTVAGAGTTGASGKAKADNSVAAPMLLWAGIGIGVVLFCAGVVLLVRKARAVTDDWA